MALTRTQSAVLHVPKKEIGLTEREYRALLYDVAGARSAKEFDSIDFALVMDRLPSLGWQLHGGKNFYGLRPAWRRSPRWISSRQYTGWPADERGLGNWLQRTFKVSALWFLSAAQAPKAIAALRVMVERSTILYEQERAAGSRASAHYSPQKLFERRDLGIMQQRIREALGAEGPSSMGGPVKVGKTYVAISRR